MESSSLRSQQLSISVSSAWKAKHDILDFGQPKIKLKDILEIQL